MPSGRKTGPTTAALPGPALRAAFEPVRRAAKGLPGIEEGTSYGTPALRVRGKFFARIWEDATTLVVRVDLDSQDSMLRLQPKIFFLTDHYRGYPVILVRLARIRARALRELLADSWRFVAPKSLVAKRGAR